MTDRTVMANVSASELLQSGDRHILWDWARNVLNSCSVSPTKVVLSNGISVVGRRELVAHQGHLFGAVLHLSLEDPKRDLAGGPTTTGLRDKGAMVPLEPYLLTGWAEPTDAERTVADLVAQGLTNNQTAKRMIMSHHTVETDDGPGLPVPMACGRAERHPSEPVGDGGTKREPATRACPC
jgi:hypothetical protein